jgi:hypothetical protein
LIVIDAVNGTLANELILEVLHNGSVVRSLASTSANTFNMTFPNQTLDLTIGDTWGIRATAGNLSSSTGTSADISVIEQP